VLPNRQPELPQIEFVGWVNRGGAGLIRRLQTCLHYWSYTNAHHARTTTHHNRLWLMGG
jgi:hypothetical protein